LMTPMIGVRNVSQVSVLCFNIFGHYINLVAVRGGKASSAQSSNKQEDDWGTDDVKTGVQNLTVTDSNDWGDGGNNDFAGGDGAAVGGGDNNCRK
jgi:hypothetical protein